MNLNDRLHSRLQNYKFCSALRFLDGEDEQVQDLVNALSDVFGDIGWFDGNLAVIVQNALNNITKGEG